MSKLLDEIGLGIAEAIVCEIPGESQVADAEYEKLAKTLGYGVADLGAFPLARFLRKNEIVVYSEQAISKYLRQLEKKEDKTANSLAVKYVPMRSMDKSRWSSTPVYDQPIPIEVLRLCGVVVTEFEEKVKFEVGVVGEKDPFLRVEHIDSGESFVIAHWDEPGFSLLGR